MSETWITQSFVPSARQRYAAWVQLTGDYGDEEAIAAMECEVITHRVVGAVVRHRVDQGDGIPCDSKVVLAVEDDTDIVPIDQLYTQAPFGYLGVFDQGEDVFEQGEVRIEIAAQEVRQDLLRALMSRRRYLGMSAA